MKRREIIKYAAFATGAALSAPLALSILSGCKPDSKNVIGKLHFFSQEEFSLIETIVDVILPKTDSPSATDVGVPRMIDSMVGTVYKAEEKENYRKNFDALFKHYSKIKFQDFSPEAQLSALKVLESDSRKGDASGKAFKELKQQTIAYYLSSEEVGTKFLTYLPVPGKYESCISVEEAGGKKYAL